MDQAAPALTLTPRTVQLGRKLGCFDVNDTECGLLRAFIENTALHLETAALLALTGPAGALGRRALEGRIVRPRKKLAQTGAPAPAIKAIRCMGFQLCVPLAISLSRHSIQGDGLP